MLQDDAMGERRTISEFKLPKIVIRCYSCDRRGVYDRDRAIERLGPDYTLERFIHEVKATCRDRVKGHCNAGCDDLMYMFNAAPFTTRYDDR